MKRREFLSLMGGAMAAFPRRAVAQAPALAWPQRVVRIIVPFVPGGGTDAVARILAAGLSKSAGYQIVIENKGGGSTNIGTEAVAHAAPDGYTVLFCSLPFAINRFLFTTLGVGFLHRFRPGDAARDLPRPDGGAEHLAGEIGRRVYRLCEGEWRQDDVLVLRDRHLDASRGRALQAPCRHRDDPHPLSRRRAGAHRLDSRAGRRGLQYLRGDAVARARRPAARPRRHLGAALLRRARPADGRRSRAAGVRRHSLVRALRPGSARRQRSCASSMPTPPPCSRTPASATSWSSSASRWPARRRRNSPGSSRPRPSCGAPSSRPPISGASDEDAQPRAMTHGSWRATLRRL